MINYEPLVSYSERYAELAYEPLEITLTLRPGSSLAGYDPLNLDNLLAYCVVQEATQGVGVPNTSEAYDLPVPLQCLWRSPAGFPLWAATPFVPVGLSERDIVYWHKRAQSGRFTGTRSGRFSITSTKGRWMERRVPLPVVVGREFVATCIGHADEIARLLQPLAFVGKRRSNGFGEVESWRIRRVESFDLVRDGKLARSLPMMAIHLIDNVVPDGQAAPVGWTPPQWKPSLFAPGWWPGTPVLPPEIDYFAAMEELTHDENLAPANMKGANDAR